MIKTFVSFGNKGAIGINKVSKEKGDCLIVEEGATVHTVRGKNY